MLIRISGGVSGIREYLETGKKQGRNYERSELDERVIILGNLELTDGFISSMDNRGEKYLHITLSFKEDSIDEETLRTIVKNFEDFAFAAYGSEEYSFYAEAHLPRIKGYEDKAKRKDIYRKPHVHIVIPKVNLITRRLLDPFGLVLRVESYIDAFQEYINCEFGLASPKDNRRVELVDRSDVLSRYKGDVFLGANKQLKASLFDEIIEHDITSFDEFESLLAARGVVRHRNPGTDREYLNLKLEGEDKGVNLKEFAFSREFITLPTKEKIARMNRRDEGYIEAAEPRPVAREGSVILKEWVEVKSRELKHLNSGRKKEYNYYSSLSAAEKQTFLAAKEKEYEKVLDRLKRDNQESSTDIRLARPVESENNNKKIQNTPIPKVLGPNNEVEQVAARHENEKRKVADEAVDLMSEIKRNIDLAKLLADLEKRKGLRKQNYSISRNRNGEQRIQCGSRNFNVADFLTKEIHLPWAEACDYLSSMYAVQVLESVDSSLSPNITKWRAYSQFSNLTIERRREDLKDIYRKMEESYTENRRSFRIKKREIYSNNSITLSERSTKLSLLQTEYLATQEKLRNEKSKKLMDYYFSLRKSILSIFIESQIMDLNLNAQELASEKEAMLGEKKPEYSKRIQSTDNNVKKSGVLLFSTLSHRVETNGDVTYFMNDRIWMRDSGSVVSVIDESPEAVEASLRLALMKFGPRLHITGPDSSKQMIIDIALKRHLLIEYKDQDMQRLYDVAMDRFRKDAIPSLGLATP